MSAVPDERLPSAHRILRSHANAAPHEALQPKNRNLRKFLALCDYFFPDSGHPGARHVDNRQHAGRPPTPFITVKPYVAKTYGLARHAAHPQHPKTPNQHGTRGVAGGVPATLARISHQVSPPAARRERRPPRAMRRPSRRLGGPREGWQVVRDAGASRRAGVYLRCRRRSSARAPRPSSARVVGSGWSESKFDHTSPAPRAVP